MDYLNKNVNLLSTCCNSMDKKRDIARCNFTEIVCFSDQHRARDSYNVPDLPPTPYLPHPSIYPSHSGSSNGAYGSHKVCFYAKLKSSYSLSPTQTLSTQQLKLPLNVQYLYRYTGAAVAQWVKH